MQYRSNNELLAWILSAASRGRDRLAAGALAEVGEVAFRVANSSRCRLQLERVS